MSVPMAPARSTMRRNNHAGAAPECSGSSAVLRLGILILLPTVAASWQGDPASVFTGLPCGDVGSPPACEPPPRVVEGNGSLARRNMAATELDILYEDNHCIAVAKPAGVVGTHYQGKRETLDRAVKAYLKQKHQKPGNVFLGVVHRLDRPV